MAPRRSATPAACAGAGTGSRSMASITRSVKSGLGSAAAWLVMASRSRAIRVSAATSSTPQALGTVELARTERARRGHRSDASTARRSRARPRCRWVFTVPSGRSVTAAISASERSAKNRSATTSR